MRTALTKSLLFAAWLCLFQFAQSQDWNQYSKILPSSLHTNQLDQYGFSVDMTVDGTHAVVGAPYDSENGAETGAAYLYEVTSSGYLTLKAKFTATDAAPYDQFGRSVAISDDHIFIGSPYNDEAGSNAGAYYQYSYSSSNNTVSLVRKGIANLQAGDNSGYSIDVDEEGYLVAVGTPGRNDDTGAVYVYTTSSGGFRERFDGSHTNQDFGDRVAIGANVGNTRILVAVGSKEYDDSNGFSVGRVDVYRSVNSGVDYSSIYSDTGDNSYDRMGTSIDIWRDERVLYGIPGDDTQASGAGKVIARNFINSRTITFYSSDPKSGDGFGSAVAMTNANNSFGYAVGASGDDDGGSSSGSIQTFEGFGGTNTTTNFIDIFEGQDALDNFGARPESLALGYRRMIAGSSLVDGDGENSGEVYSYYDNSTDYQFFERDTEIPDDYNSTLGFEYGYSIDIDGDYAVVGAPNDNAREGSGLAYVLQRNSNGTWSKRATLKPSDGESRDGFGTSVSISGDYIAVGSPAHDNDGAVYIYVKGSSWSGTDTEAQKITASDASSNDDFGWSVDVDGTSLIVGAPDAPGLNNSGAAYIFQLSGTWSETAKLTPSNGVSGDDFGWSVAIEGDLALAGSVGDDDNGSSSGSVYLFKQSGGAWTNSSETTQLLASNGSSSDRLGQSTEIESGLIVVGADGAPGGGSSNGAVYLYEEPGSGWPAGSLTENYILTASDGASSDDFGWSIAVESDRIVVGAPRRNEPTDDEGSIYVFDKPEMGWMTMTETEKLLPNDPITENVFGYSVGTSSNIIVSGTPVDNDGEPIISENAGAVFIHERDEAPTDISLSANSIAENSTAGTTIGTLNSEDLNRVDVHSYDVSGVDASSFQIGGTNNDELQVTGPFDFESKDSYSVTITSTDGTGLTFEETFTIGVTDDEDTPTDISLSGSFVGDGDVETVEILQNQAVGYLIGTLTSTDQDAGATHTYTIGGTDAASFQIGGTNNNELQANEVFNHDTQNSFSIVITTTDNDGLAYMEDFIIEILPNQTPTDIGLDGAAVTENNSATTLVGNLTTVDADVADEHSYTISGTDASSFTLGGTNDNELYTTETFDFETKNSYDITITTDDGLGGTFDEDFTITVINENDNEPTDISLDNSSINENVASGASIATISTTDGDGEDEFTYTLSGTDEASFSIGGDNEDELLNAESFDFETKSSYQITITTTDAGGLTHDENFTISVEDVNDDPSDIQLSNASIQENLVTGTVIGSLTTSDQDGSDSHTYSVVGDNSSFFQIGGSNNDELQSAASFDLESVGSYSITINADDGNEGSLQKEFTIAITNENETPISTTFLNDENQIEENLPVGTVVATLVTVDPDEGDTHTYALFGEDATFFDIDGANIISAVSFDYETQELYQLEIATTDAGGRVYTDDDYQIRIEDGPDAPTDINLSISEVEENQGANFVIGELSTSDVDDGDTHSYSITGTDAASFDTDGSNLISAVDFDFEIKNSYTITITTEDEAGLTHSESFSITVTDNNDDPSDLILSSSSVDEQLSSGTLVGVLSAIDQDPGDTHTFTILDGDTDFFELGGVDNDQILTTATFDFETKSSYLLLLRTQDNNGGSRMEKVTININDTNDQPTDLSISDNGIVENDPTGTLIGIMTTEDQDEGDTYTYTITGEDASYFQVDGAELQVAIPANFEEQDSYLITITSTDQGGLTVSDEFSFNVGDRNDTPTQIELSANNIEENANMGTFIGSLTTDDEDPEQVGTHTYSISGADASSFTLSGDNIDELVSVTPFDFETKSEYLITITTEDPGGATFNEDFVINVTDTNDEPTGISIDHTNIVINRPVGSVIATISTEDQDANDSHTYSIKAGADADNFQISGNELQAAVVIDGTQSSYAITLVTTDSEGETYGDSFTLTVIPNNTPTALSLSNTIIASGLDVGSVVGDLSTTDADQDDTFTYTISGTDASNFQIGGENNDELQVAEKLFYTVQPSYSITITSTDLSGATISDDYTIEIMAVLNAEIDEQFVTTYPNPSNGQFTISTSKDWNGASLQLIDLNGAEVSIDTTALTTDSQTINTRTTSGIYFLVLKKGNKQITKKIVIE